MIPPCRYCDGEGCVQDSTDGPWSGCPRCHGSQLDEAWCVTFTRERPGFTRIHIAYGAHAATQPVADKELTDEAADLLADVLGPRVRRGLILRDNRP